MRKNSIQNLKNTATCLRLEILEMVVRANGGHIGGSFSVIDLLVALYLRVLNVDPSDPSWEGRDRLLFSKGHSCLALYTVLAECGYFEKSRLETYAVNGGAFAGHPEHGFIPGVEITAGSLGHGPSLGVGMALAAKIDSSEHKVFVVSSDGELNEGSVWEAIMSAAQFKLDNLTLVIDYNKYISLGTIDSIMSVSPLEEKLEDFGWSVRSIDGHNMQDIVTVFEQLPFDLNQPSAIISHTIKGKGVSFMENVPMWHFRTPTEAEACEARAELQLVLES